MTNSLAPSHNTDLSLERAAAARAVIDPCFLDTPQYEDELLNRALGRRVLVKVETANPIRSFKGRGAGFALHQLPAGDTVVCASSGNFGQAVAYAGRARGLRVRVFTPDGVNAAKRARMVALGADVVAAGPDTGTAHAAAAAAAAGDPAVHLITDGVAAAVAEGNATIAEELCRTGGFDSVVVPVGDGALISGIALWLRAHAPATRILGVNPAAAPAMARSTQAGTPVRVETAGSFAEGITVPQPYSESLARVRALVDEIVLVDDADISAAMTLVARHLSVIPEPAGAAGIAAIANGHGTGARVATLVTGANPTPAVLTDLAARLPA